MITAIGKCQKGRETGCVTVIDNVLRKALTETITRDLKKEWAQGKSEASAQLVLGASYCLALQGTEILCLLCWGQLGFGPSQFSHHSLLTCHGILMTGATLCSSAV